MGAALSPSSARRETRRPPADLSKRERRRARLRRPGRRRRPRRSLRLRPPLAHGFTDAAVARAVPPARGRARRHGNVIVSPLVARVGLVGTRHLSRQFLTLERVAPSRVICALGSGDNCRRPRTRPTTYRVRSADERRAMMAETARSTSDLMPCGSAPVTTRRIKWRREVGATINLWDASAIECARWRPRAR